MLPAHLQEITLEHNPIQNAKAREIAFTMGGNFFQR